MNATSRARYACSDAALDYAQRGWHVFPVPPGTKKSYLAARHGNGARWGATSDPGLIRNYWTEWPDANVGIACGPSSRLFVVECDTMEGHGVDGVGAMAALLERHGPLPDTIEALSPSGSWHIYFRWPDAGGVGNSSGRIAPGIDVRGDGGMVVAAPSVKPGMSCQYHWKNPPGLFGLADCPEWLLALCTRKASAAETSARAEGDRFHIDTGLGAFGDDKASAAEVAEMLSWIDPDAGGYHAWVNILMALHHHFLGGADGLALAEEWSQRGAKFVPGEVAAKWAGFRPDGGATIRSVAEGARRNGADLSDIARRHRRGKASHGRGSSRSQGESGPDEPESTAAEPDGIDLSDDALARDLGRRGWDRDAKHVAVQNRWYLWDGASWAADDRLHHMTLARGFLNSRAVELCAWAERKAADTAHKETEKSLAGARGEARRMRSAHTVAAVIGLARSNPASVARVDDFDTDLLLLGTPGGTVDLRTGLLRPARREDMITRLTAVAPTPPGTPAPIWQQFLHEVFDGDEDLIAFMQRAAGYALTGLTTEHKLLFLYGTGRNGKSTFLDTLQWLWGDYSRRAAATTFLSSVGERHPTDIAGLNGARLVVGSELPKGKSWDEAVLKDLTGGDLMTARFMRGDFFDFVPQMTLMIAGNTMPSFRGVDEALRARIVLVPFTVTIPPERRNPMLPEKLRGEGPAILRWAVDGALEWQRRGLAVPASVAAASTDYLDGEDTLGQFLADETVTDPGAFTYTSDLHVRFRQWMEGQGLAPWTSHTLTKELKSRGFKDDRRTSGRGFFGLRLKGA